MLGSPGVSMPSVVNLTSIGLPIVLLLGTGTLPFIIGLDSACKSNNTKLPCLVNPTLPPWIVTGKHIYIK